MRHVQHVRHGFAGAAVACAAFGLAPLLGCDSVDSSGPATTGRLVVAITAPAGVTPSVTVSGPTGYQQTLTAAQTLTGLAPGTYTVTAGSVFALHPIVATIYDGTVTDGTVSLANGTEGTASVSYAARSGTGTLWVGSEAGGIGSSQEAFLGYSATQLEASTSAAPSITLVPYDNAVPAAAAVAADGTLWAAMNGDNQLALTSTVIGFGLNQFQLAASLPYPVTPRVKLSLTSRSHDFLRGIALDADGGVWFADRIASTIDALTPNQLAATGTPTPAITLSASSGSLSGPSALAFDMNYNLWVANATTNSVVEFAPSLRAASGSPTPTVMLSARSGSLDGPSALAFDSDGNLWVANAHANTVVRFNAIQLGASGSPIPAVTLSATSGSLNGPSSVVVDASGDLWVANEFSSTVVEFGANQVGASGAPTPMVTVSGSTLSAPHSLVFSPSPLSCAGCWDYDRVALVARNRFGPRSP